MAGDTPLSTVPLQRGIVFFAHGSRDPRWSLPIEAVAQQLQDQHPQALCSCAYLELMAPDLPTATQALVDQGCTHITVLPMFLGMGKHARVDLPAIVQALQSQHPQLQLHIATPVGEDPRVTQLLAEIAAQHLT